MAFSISSGIGGTMVLRCSGRFSVMVATGPSVLYRIDSNSGVVGIAAVESLSPEKSREALDGAAQVGCEQPGRHRDAAVGYVADFHAGEAGEVVGQLAINAGRLDLVDHPVLGHNLA